MSKAAPKRKFIKERRRNACPACLDRQEQYDRQPLVPDDRKPLRASMGGQYLGPCEICGGREYVHEVSVVGMEWRRYPWVIVE